MPISSVNLGMEDELSEILGTEDAIKIPNSILKGISEFSKGGFLIFAFDPMGKPVIYRGVHDIGYGMALDMAVTDYVNNRESRSMATTEEIVVRFPDEDEE